MFSKSPFQIYTTSGKRKARRADRRTRLNSHACLTAANSRSGENASRCYRHKERERMRPRDTHVRHEAHQHSAFLSSVTEQTHGLPFVIKSLHKPDHVIWKCDARSRPAQTPAPDRKEKSRLCVCVCLYPRVLHRLGLVSLFAAHLNYRELIMSEQSCCMH